MVELGYWDWPEALSDVRGAALNGHEYALLGSYTGLSIIDVTDPTDLEEVAWFGGPGSTWRDPFYYNGHAYCVTEGGGGMLIVDMTPLPGNTNLQSTYYTGDNYTFGSAHNMFIDENGIAFIFGTTSYNGAIMLDLSQDPMNPVELGVWYDYYIHDAYVRGDTMWAGCLQDGVQVVDVSDHANPVNLASWQTPGSFAHNIWMSDDGNHAFTTDEISSGYVAAYDVSDLSNVVETDRYNEPLTQEVIPHNTHYKNGWLVTSHYKDGVTIYDAHDPSNLIMTGYFDSPNFEGNGFNGCWGVWPYLPSGNILMSDMSNGFYVLGHDYQLASYLDGTVTEVVSGNLLSGVSVDIESAVPLTETDIFGNYSSGTGNPGLYNVSFNRAGYLPLLVEDVNLVSGQTTTLDVELVPDTPFVFVGQLLDAVTGDPINGGSVDLDNPFFQISATSDVNGIISDSTFYSGNYVITAGMWGYQMFCEEVSIGSEDTLFISLQPGYQDNFDLDLGWAVSGNASAGVWEHGQPVATEYDGDQANPGNDSPDCGSNAYITGNAGGSAGDDDVDNGNTILTSPSMDLTGLVHPFVHFDHWFFNDGGNSTPNDMFTVSIDNGISTTIMDTLYPTDSQWASSSYLLEIYTTLTADMTLILETADDEPGHLVEAGIDNFRVIDVPNLSATSKMDDNHFDLYPNPVSGPSFTVNISTDDVGASLSIRDLTGRIVYRMNGLSKGKNELPTPEVSGVYIIEVETKNSRSVKRCMIQK